MLEIFKILGTVALNGTSEVNKELDSVAGKGEGTQSKLSASFKKIGTAVITYFAVDKIKDFGLACVETAASVKASNSQFEQTFGKMQSEASKAMKAVADDSGILQTKLQDTGTSIYAFARTTGADSATSLDIMKRALQVTADSAAYYDRSLEDTAESLKSFLKGNYENDAALGLSCTETTRNTAANKLFGKSFKDLSEAQKQLTLLQMVEDANELSGAMGQASRESDGYENVMGNLNESWRQFQATIGAPVLSALIPIIQKLTDGISWLNAQVKNADVYYQKLLSVGKSFSTWCSKHQTELALVAVAIGTLTAALIAYNASSIAKKAADLAETVAIYGLIAAENIHTATTAIATTATTAFGAAVSFLTSPITLVVAAIGGLIAVGVLLYKNWETVSSFAKSVWGSITSFIDSSVKNIMSFFGRFSGAVSTVKGIFNGIKSAITSPVKTAKNLIKSAIDKIKGFFNFKISWPKIKLPHFSIKGSFNPVDWITKGLPKIGVSWYAKAMDNPIMLTKPTIFGMSNGQFLGGGEAGNELVIGKNSLMEMIRNASSSGNTELLSILCEIRDYIADDDRWYRIMLKALADGSLAIILDGREVGRIVKKYA